MAIFPLVDDRLVHGQVLLFWRRHWQIDKILVANDAVAMDELRKSALRLIIPPALSCEIVTVAQAATRLVAGTAETRTLLLLASPVDAWDILKWGAALKHVNVANLSARPGAKKLTPHLYVTQEERWALDRLSQSGVAVTAKQLPHSSDAFEAGVPNIAQ